MATVWRRTSRKTPARVPSDRWSARGRIAAGGALGAAAGVALILVSHWVEHAPVVLPGLVLGLVAGAGIGALVTLLRPRPVADQSERDPVDAALGEASHEVIRAAVEHAGIAILVGDPKTGTVIAGNKAAAEMFGYTPAELAGLPIASLHPPDDDGADEAGWREIESGVRDSYRIDKRYVRKDGEIRWTAMTVSVVRAADGSPRFGLALLQDITARREAVLALRDREARLTAMVDSAPIGILISDIDPDRGIPRIAEANPELCRMLGYDADELYSKTMRDLMHPDDLAVSLTYAQDLVAGRRSAYNHRVRFNAKSGDVVWCQSSVATIPNETGEFRFGVAMIEDVTEQVKAVEALRESEERLRAILNTAPVGILMSDYDSSRRAPAVMAANPELHRMFGYEPDALVGLTMRDLIHSDDLDVSLARADDLVSGRIGGYGMRKRYIRKDGSLIWGEVSASPVRRDDGTFRYAVAVIADVTEQVAAEAALRESEERLHAMVQQTQIGILWHPPTGPQTWNPALRRMLGIDESDDELPHLITFCHPDDFPESRRQWDRMRAGEIDTYRMQKRYVRRDETVVWVDLSVTALRDVGGGRGWVVALIEDVTEQVKAVEALRENEWRLNAMMERSQIGIGWEDAQGRQQWNPALRRMLGVADDATGLPQLIAYSHPDDRADSQKQWDRMIGGDQDSFQLRKRYIRTDGQEVWADVSTTLLRDEAGKKRWAVALIEDVTERVRTEQTLRESEERFRLLAERTSDGLFIYEGGRITYTSPGYDRLVRADTPGDSVGMSDRDMLEMIHPDDRDALIARFDDALANRSPTMVNEYRWRRGDGEYRWREDRHTLVFDEAGGFLRAYGIACDVTDRKLAELALEESEERFRLLAERTSDGLFIFEKGRVTYTSPSFDRMTQAPSAGDAVGRTEADLMELIHPDDREQVLARFAEAVRNRGETVVHEFRWRAPDGEYRWREDRHTLIYDDTGAPSRIYGVARDVTDRKLAELALEESEERFRAAFQSSAAVQLMIDPGDGRVVGANPAACEFYGWTPDALGEPCIFDINQLPEAEVRAQMREAQRSRRQFRFRHRVGSGEIRDVDVFAGPIRFGGKERLLSIIVDVTDRVKAEAALQLSEQRHREYIEAALSAVFVVDPAGTFDEVNPAACKLVGYDRDDLIGMHLSALDMPGAAGGEVGKNRFAELQRRGRLRFERRMLRKNGGFVDVDMQTSRLSDGRFMAVCHDITERKRMAAALSESETRYRRLFELSPDGFIVTDEEGRIVDCNDAWLALDRATAEQSIGSLCFDRHADPAEAAGIGRQMFAQAQRDGHAAFETGLQRRDGTTYTGEVSLAAFPMRGRTWVQAIVRDVSDRLRYQRELAEAAERAERLAREAESANAAKTAFLANMSHEIRTPLNGVIGMLGMLGDEPLSPAGREYARTAHAAANQLLALINDLLDVTRIEAGGLELDEAMIDLERTLDELAVLFTPRAGRQVEFIVGARPGVPRWVIGDPTRLRQVLVNLTDNALKFTERGEVSVIVDLADDPAADADDETVLLRFTVRDSGIGFSSGDRKKLFKTFSQLDPAVGRRTGGTGLGLAISARLVELMGGTIDADAEPGVGAVFTFTARLQRTEGVPTEPDPDLAGKSAAVIAPNPRCRRVHVDRLRSWGAREVQEFDRPPQSLPDADVVVIVERPGAVDDAQVDPPAPAADGRLVVRGTQPLTAGDLRTALIRRHAAPTPGAGLTLGPDIDTAGRRVLAVEDNPTNRLVITRILERLGLKVDTAVDGREALEILSSPDARYDLVFMDLRMPEIDGATATRAIRDPESPAYAPDLPIVALTAGATEADRAECRAVGMNDYLAKPVEPMDIVHVLRRLLPRA
jgi:PAS domain S-box-containing protein